MKKITRNILGLILFAVVGGAVSGGIPKVLMASETAWSPTEARTVYTGPPYSTRQRYNVLPSVVRLPDGTLVALVEPKKLIFIRSKDGGKSWTEPYVGVSQKENFTLNALGVRRDGCLVGVFSQANENLGTSSVEKRTEKLPDGREGQTYTGYRYSGDLYLGYSKDQGKTWTAGKQIYVSPMISAWTWTMGRVLELDNGTLIVPVGGYLSLEDMDGIWLSAGVVRSDDEGATWSFSVLGRGNPSNWTIFSEPSLAQLDDGTLVAMMRSEDRVTRSSPGDPRGTRYGLHRATSKDGGKTWTSPAMSIPNATHCSLASLADGVLLCGYHSHNPRLGLSGDGGLNWYANMLWSIEDPAADWGYYTSVEVVDENTAVMLIKETPATNIIRACLLRRQP